MKLYRNKYLIGLYETGEVDSLFALLENSRQFAEFFNITINNACTILKQAFDKKTHFFRYKGRMLEIAFINDVD